MTDKLHNEVFHNYFLTTTNVTEVTKRRSMGHHVACIGDMINAKKKNKWII